MTVDPELLQLLVCPLSRKSLIEHGQHLVSLDPDSRRSYPIEDGIPILLVERGRELPLAEWQAILAEAGAEAES